MRILQFILCIPLWMAIIPALTGCLDRVCNAIDGASDSFLYQVLVVPVVGLVVSVLIPAAFLCVGLLVWCGVGLLLGTGF